MQYRHRRRNKRSVVMVVSGLLAFGSVLGHIKNEATQFPDIEFSAARFDIVVLVGAGIIPQTPVFEPDKTLSNAELASWAALAEGLGRGGENPDSAALAAAALEKGMLGSLEGDASYADLNRLFFAGQLSVADGQQAPTKAEAASYIATSLSGAAGQALLEKRNLTVGGGGVVTAVTIEEGHHGNAYVMTVGDQKLQMDEHGRVANGPIDLLQWEGRNVRRSFVRGSGDDAKWIYLEAEPRERAPVIEASPETGAPLSNAPSDDFASDAAAKSPTDRSMLYWLVLVVAILGVLLFFRRRQGD